MAGPNGDVPLIGLKYLQVRELIVEKAKKDPPEEPYKSKYKAKEILEEMKLELNKDLDDDEDCQITSTISKGKAQLAVVYFYLGSISVEVEELSTGEEFLSKAEKTIEGSELHPDCILCFISTLNQQGLLWCLRSQEEKAFSYLDKSEKMYKSFKELSNAPPTDFVELFTGKPREEDHKSPEVKLEDVHTLTLFFLAQVYKTLEKPLKSAQYCHWTLRRQLTSKDFDKVEWAINSATLSQFLLEKNAFKAARHHLAAASYIMDLHKEELNLIHSESEQYEAGVEQYNMRKSDISRCWAKYGICLLSTSKARLESDEGERELFKVPGELEELWFETLDLREYENEVSSEFLLTFEDARPVFLFSQDSLGKAKNYYTLEDHASDFVSLQQDLSQLYCILAFFEDNEGRQCKMHKRRIDILTSLLSSISPIHYLQQTRELLFELAEVYTTIMDIKNSLTLEDGRSGSHSVNKHNILCQKAIENFTLFIETFKDKRTNYLPEIFPEEYERMVLLAHVHSARLKTKFITSDKHVLLQNNKASFEIYKFVVDYCKRREEGKLKLEGEYSLCVDMVNLLPIKIAKILQICDSV